MIKVSAPGKLMLFGEHAVVYGKPCIVTAIDQRISVLLEKKGGEKIYLNTRAAAKGGEEDLSSSNTRAAAKGGEEDKSSSNTRAVDEGEALISTFASFRKLGKRRVEKNECSSTDTQDVNIKNYVIFLNDLDKPYPKEISFVLTSIKNFFEKYSLKSGLEIKTGGGFSSKFGLGSSSAITVSTIKGLAELFRIKINKKELFSLAYKTVLDIQGMGSGFDLAAAIYGGTLFFVTGGKVIEPMKVSEPPIIIGYTGIKADTSTLIKMVQKKLQKEPEKINKIFDEIEEIVNFAKIEIENSHWEKVGELMNLNQELLRKLGVSSEKLENLIKAVLKSGALGAKLSGAGGGDCMIAIANRENLNNLKIAIEKVGGRVIETKTQAEGVKADSF